MLARNWSYAGLGVRCWVLDVGKGQAGPYPTTQHLTSDTQFRRSARHFEAVEAGTVAVDDQGGVAAVGREREGIGAGAAEGEAETLERGAAEGGERLVDLVDRFAQRLAA